jgi:uncharacterized Zn finger protein
MSWHSYEPDDSVAQRRLKAEKKIKALKDSGEPIFPIAASKSRGLIAKSFWGKAWCTHLEGFNDYINRLPRGRSYVRNGSVLHLAIESGTVTAMVLGSELYELSITIKPLPTPKWTALKKQCQGKIGSLIELLQGKISDEIMTLVTDPTNGLFPQPKEIHFNCNCPDWANMCKHVAAVAYGIGIRLDTEPELLFELRGVNKEELISVDTAVDQLTSGTSSRRRRTLGDAAIGQVFGIDLSENSTELSTNQEIAPARRPQPTTPTASKKSPLKKTAKKTAKNPVKTPPTSKAKPTPKTPPHSKASDPALKPIRPTAALIRRLRKQHGLTPSELADALGVNELTVKHWEMKTGPLKLQKRSLENLIRFAQEED